MVELFSFILLGIVGTSAFVGCMYKTILRNCNTRGDAQGDVPQETTKISGKLLPENITEEEEPPCYNYVVK